MAKEVLEGGEGSGFIALSGGYGTLEELMEVVTWNQLGIHNRGVVVLNVEGYWYVQSPLHFWPYTAPGAWQACCGVHICSGALIMWTGTDS